VIQTDKLAISLDLLAFAAFFCDKSRFKLALEINQLAQRAQRRVDVVPAAYLARKIK
jgi:hypothetical protein